MEFSAPTMVYQAVLFVGLYFVLKDCGTLIGGIIGLSALAWAHFFQAVVTSNLGHYPA